VRKGERIRRPELTPAAMRVRISDENYLSDLIAFLERAGYLVEPVTPRELITSPVPRSLRLERLRLELDLHLRAWEVAHPGITAIQTLGPGGAERARRHLRRSFREADESEDRG
jgi:hypothetical protein